MTGFLNRFLKSGPNKDEEKMEEESVNRTAADIVEPETTASKIEDADRDRELELRIADKLREIFDPEIPVNIYELGLVYDIRADKKGNVQIVMTLTTPHCPVAESMPGEVEMKARDVEEVNDVKVDLVWEPAWDMTMMSEAARLELGLM